MRIAGRFPGDRGMTDAAGLRGRDMSGRLRIGTGSLIASVMASLAIAGSNRTGRSGVIHGGRIESNIVLVTGIALRCRRNMVGRLAQRGTAVMAVRTDAGYRRYCRCMVEGTSRPGCRRIVASTALRRRGNVRNRLDLRVLRNIGAAVTGRATGQARMVHRGRRPGSIARLVTGITLPGRRDMQRRFG